MSDFENSAEQEAADVERDRLLKATSKQAKVGPKGLHPGSSIDWEAWQKTRLDYSRGIHDFSDIIILVWCRIYISIVPISSDTILVHYSFENLYDGELPLKLKDALFHPWGLKRQWVTEDITTGERRNATPYLTGVSSNFRRRKLSVLLAPDPFSNRPELASPSVATVTRIYVRREDGSWYIDGFGECVPSHTYKFQLLFGTLPSNVFTWTVPG